MLVNLSLMYDLGYTKGKSWNIALRQKGVKEVKVYLIHFDQKLKHAGHYVGSAENLPVRINDHRKGKGARIIQVINELGIGWKVVRVWSKGGRDLEKRIKRARNHPRLCPICNPGITIEKFVDPERDA